MHIRLEIDPIGEWQMPGKWIVLCKSIHVESDYDDYPWTNSRESVYRVRKCPLHETILLEECRKCQHYSGEMPE